jgi:homocitrate synthase NifV
MFQTIPRNVWIVDTTLRDGLQAPGFVLTPREKMFLADKLDVMGVPELEAGFPGAGEQECRFVRYLVRRKLKTRLSCWCRALPADIESAARCGASSVHISFPVSDRLLGVFNKDHRWLFRTLAELVRFAKNRFSHVSVGMQDASRADRAILADFVDATAAAGSVRLRAADSVGILTPAGTARLIGFIRKRAPALDIDFHGHNDLGMATANTIAAVEAGATSVNVTVNGIGERAGNARLEEVAVALSLGLGVFTGVDETQVVDVSRIVAQMSQRPLPPDKPISGKIVFTHESGIHGAAQIKDGLAYQPFPACRVGCGEQPLLAGMITGKHVLRHLLETKGIKLSPRQCLLFTEVVKRASRLQKRAFDMHEIAGLWERFSLDGPHREESG